MIPYLLVLPLFLFGFIWIHNFLMGLVANHIWGLYWYGLMWCIPFITLLICLIEFRQIPKWIVTICVGLSAASSAYTFYFTNQAYKDFHHNPYRPLELIDVFTLKTDRYAISDQYNDILYSKTHEIWETRENPDCKSWETTPMELAYLIPELALDKKCPEIYGILHKRKFLGTAPY
jgi:hypothetical protein